MKKIIGILFSVFIIYGILFVYFDIEKITDYTIKFFIPKNEVIIKDSNEYKRNYEYQKFSISDDYDPLNRYELENIYFNILNNGWNNFTFYCPEEYVNCLNDVREISENSNLMSNINNYVNPFNSYKEVHTSLSEQGDVNVNIIKSYTDNEINDVNIKLDIIINELNINSLSDIDKLRTIKDYLIKNIKYDDNFVDKDTSSNSTKATGALLSNTAVCSGYSDTFALFLDRFNIPNIKVSSENHIWNLVYINNEWKHIDITWSDTDTNINLHDKFFLISKNELLNLDEKEHSFDTTFFIEAN